MIFSRKSYSYSQEMRDMEQEEVKKLKAGLHCDALPVQISFLT